jgi:hypothetical protein
VSAPPNDLGSWDQSDFVALMFSDSQNAGDCLSKRINDWDDWFSGQLWDIPKSYEEGHVVIVIRFHVNGDGKVFDLIFGAVPPIRKQDAAVRQIGGMETVGAAGQFDTSDTFVLAGVTNFVQSPNGLIPSFVWLEAAKHREDIRRDIFASAASYNILIKHLGGISYWEIGSLGFDVSSEGCGSKGDLIQRSAQMFNSLNGKPIEIFRDGFD